MDAVGCSETTRLVTSDDLTCPFFAFRTTNNKLVSKCRDLQDYVMGTFEVMTRLTVTILVCDPLLFGRWYQSLECTWCRHFRL